MPGVCGGPDHWQNVRCCFFKQQLNRSLLKAVQGAVKGIPLIKSKNFEKGDVEKVDLYMVADLVIVDCGGSWDDQVDVTHRVQQRHSVDSDDADSKRLYSFLLTQVANEQELEAFPPCDFSFEKLKKIYRVPCVFPPLTCAPWSTPPLSFARLYCIHNFIISSIEVSASHLMSQVQHLFTSEPPLTPVHDCTLQVLEHSQRSLRVRANFPIQSW
jgi:hypothetical protein